MADFVPQWLEDLEEAAEEKIEEFTEGVEEVGEFLSEGIDYWRGRLNEAVDSLNEHQATISALQSKKEALETFKTYLTQYKDTIGELHEIFAGFDTTFLENTYGSWRDAMYDNMHPGFGPDHLYNLGIAHVTSHDSLIALVDADISALSDEIFDEQTSLDWLNGVIDEIRADARAAGFSI